MRYKIPKIAALVLSCLFGLVTSVLSVSYTTIEGDKSALPGIKFDLTYSHSGSGYNAVFSIKTPTFLSFTSPSC
jgi:hypothetical protein